MARKNCKNHNNHRNKSSCPKSASLKSSNLDRHERKEFLVKMLGGHCKNCGYNKSLKALSFHHLHPENKKFDISNNGNLMRNWSEVITEAKKCELLCLNCHAEINVRK